MRPRFKDILLGVLAVVGLFVTLPKLQAMAQIRGWLPGAEARTVVITDKWHQTAAEHHEGREVYWIAWGGEEIRKVGHHRLNLLPEDWAALDVGQQLELVLLPGDPTPHLRNSIFDSAGNFAIDLLLLGVELTLVFRLLNALFPRRVEALQRPDRAGGITTGIGP
jgi:hypothetical protein